MCRAETGIGLEEAWSMTVLFATLGGRNKVSNGLINWPVKPEPGGYPVETLIAGKKLWTQTIDSAGVPVGTSVPSIARGLKRI